MPASSLRKRHRCVDSSQPSEHVRRVPFLPSTRSLRVPVAIRSPSPHPVPSSPFRVRNVPTSLFGRPTGCRAGVLVAAHHSLSPHVHSRLAPFAGAKRTRPLPDSHSGAKAVAAAGGSKGKAIGGHGEEAIGGVTRRGEVEDGCAPGGRCGVARNGSHGSGGGSGGGGVAHAVPRVSPSALHLSPKEARLDDGRRGCEGRGTLCGGGGEGGAHTGKRECPHRIHGCVGWAW